MERMEAHPWKWLLSSQFQDLSGFVWFGVRRYPFRCDFRLCIFIEFYFEHKEQVSKKLFTLGAMKISNLQTVILCSKNFCWGDIKHLKKSNRWGLKDFKIYLQKCKILYLQKRKTEEEFTVHSPGNFWQSVQKRKIKLLCPHLPSPITWMDASTNIEWEEKFVTKVVFRDRVKMETHTSAR